MPPEVEGEGVHLTQFRERHFDRLAQMHGDPATMRFMGGHMERDEAWRGMARMVGQWELRGYGIYAVEDDNGVFVGRCGIFHPLDWPERELGYCIHPDARGKGYATAAALAVRDAARGEGLRRLISLINPQNTASLRVAERLGTQPADAGHVPDGPVVRHLHDMTPLTRH